MRSKGLLHRMNALLVFSAIGFSLATAPPPASSSAGQNSEQQPEGIYTKSQALRGEALYDEHCASCHGLKLEGTPSSPLAGEKFMKKWGQGRHTVDDLFYFTRTQMPDGNAGALRKQQYIDVVAYILKKNGYSPGERELPPEPAILQKTKISPQDGSKKTNADQGGSND